MPEGIVHQPSLNLDGSEALPAFRVFDRTPFGQATVWGTVLFGGEELVADEIATGA